MKRPTVGIAGAGIIGRLVAFEMLQLGWDVTLVDKSDGRHSASFAAAGMLAPWAELETADETIARLGIASLDRWPQILEACHAEEAFTRRGSLIVAHARDAAELRRLAARVRRHFSDGIEELDGAGLHDLEPGLESRFRHGLFFSREGHVDNRAAMAALLVPGIKTHWNEEVHRVGDGTISSSRGRHAFDRVIDCRGVGGKGALGNLRGVRGEIVRVYAPEVDLARPVRCLHPRYPIYVVPRSGHQFVIGATSLESEDDSPISVRSLLELLSTVYSLHSGFGEARVLETDARVRPAFPDHLPRARVAGRRLLLNGFYRHGFLVGPEVARQVASYLQTGERPALFTLEEEVAA